jgi:predicted signal transduction protein with EAL and GGDEF domain
MAGQSQLLDFSDRLFVRDLGSNRNAQAIVRAIISLGVGLGVTITAEGVETEAEFSCLRARGLSRSSGLPVQPRAAERRDRRSIAGAVRHYRARGSRRDSCAGGLARE